ncbi:MAG: hypothetical protein RIT27_228 [Pseudomonadota bacterium]|jgi:transglutaminase-like putative cysteine protease
MLLSIQHETRYAYENLVDYSIQHLRLTPRPDSNQKTHDWQLIVQGTKQLQIDGHGNIGHLLTLDRPRQEISIIVKGLVETTENFCLVEHNLLSPFIYLLQTPLTTFNAAIRTFTQESLKEAHDLGIFAALMNAIGSYMAFDSDASQVHDTALQAFERKRGVCQDYAHLFVACCRSVGIPARYVSGYVYTGDDGHLASHAWADGWLEPYGWVSCDPTHQIYAGEPYCRLAVGRDYLDACPVRGVRRGGGLEKMQVLVNVAAQQQ